MWGPIVSSSQDKIRGVAKCSRSDCKNDYCAKINPGDIMIMVVIKQKIVLFNKRALVVTLIV